MFKKTMLTIVLLSVVAVTGSAMWWSNKVKKDERIVFFPTLGYWDKASAQWHVQIHGWIFEPEFMGDMRRLIRAATGHKESHNDQSLFKKRTSGFLVDNERGKRITVAVGKTRHVIANRSKPNGHFQGLLKLPAAVVNENAKNGVLTFAAVLSPGDRRRFEGRVHLLPEQGTSVVSDIDDTIKVSNVTDKKALLRNTFYEPFKVSPGMPAYYRLLGNLPDVSFHYVSASPWQLYEVLDEFRAQQNYPAGSFHMKLFRLKDRSLANLFTSPIQYKLDIIEPMLRRYPRREFILIGDSGEKDPEVYGILARRYPEQISKVLIRLVPGHTGEDARFKSAFDQLPAKLWVTFTHPDEIP